MAYLDKPCVECIHTNVKASSEPCKSCINKSNWEQEQEWHKEACNTWWNRLTEENKEIIQQIPNFNKEIFFEITGIKL